MAKAAKLFCLLLLALNVANAGCGRKPVPADSSVNQPASNQAQTNVQQTPQPAPGDGTAASQAQNQQPAGAPPPPPQQPPAQKVPSFVDMAKGGAKDIPNYPRLSILNLFYGPGPQPGYDSMRITGQANGSLDEIAAFYEKAIKDNGWTVVNKIRNPERVEWLLKKGDKDEGAVVAQFDTQSKVINMLIVRSEKTSETGQ